MSPLLLLLFSVLIMPVLPADCFKSAPSLVQSLKGDSVGDFQHRISRRPDTLPVTQTAT